MPSVLHDNAKKCQFDKIIDRVVTHPNEASQQTEHGDTCLHLIATKDTPMHVLKVVVKAYPQAAILRNKWDKLPLDYAIENHKSSPDIISFLRGLEKDQYREEKIRLEKKVQSLTKDVERLKKLVPSDLAKNVKIKTKEELISSHVVPDLKAHVSIGRLEERLNLIDRHVQSLESDNKKTNTKDEEEFKRSSNKRQRVEDDMQRVHDNYGTKISAMQEKLEVTQKNQEEFKCNFIEIWQRMNALQQQVQKKQLAPPLQQQQNRSSK